VFLCAHSGSSGLVAVYTVVIIRLRHPTYRIHKLGIYGILPKEQKAALDQNIEVGIVPKL
jgi:hypothetical protein